MKRVVITGMGVVSPLGCSIESLWNGLISGTNGIHQISKFDISNFPVRIAAEVKDFDVDAFVDPKLQRRSDPYTHYALAAAEMAVRESGIDFSKEDPYRCGCIVSSGVGGIYTTEKEILRMKDRGPTRISPFCIPEMIVNMASGLVAIKHGLKGPNFAVVSACATGLHSIGCAMRAIRYGEADVMVTGGTEAPIVPVAVAGFAAAHALSTSNDDPEHACRPFDMRRNGFIMGEGSAVLILEEYEHAAARGADIYAEVAGFGETCDAFHMTAPAENGEGGAHAMMFAMKDAGVPPEKIDYLNAHGTSTPMNDRVETCAVKSALGESAARSVAISSTKSMTGHMLGAAGAVESIVCALAIRNGIIPPTINYGEPDPDCDLDYTPNTAREKKVDICLNNSLGFGGHNACALFRRV